MFNNAAKLTRAASGAATLAKPEPASTSIQSVSSVTDKPMHSSNTNSLSTSTKTNTSNSFFDLVNQRAKALDPVLPQKQSNELENKKQQAPEIDFENEAEVEIEVENLNMAIKALDELVKVWKNDLDCAKKLHCRKEKKAINAKIRMAREEEINLMNKKSIIKLTSEITKQEKELEKLNIKSAEAVKINKLATARSLYLKINETETDLAALKNIKEQVLKDIAQANITSAPKSIETKVSPTKQSFEIKTVAPSKDQIDSVTLSKEFALLDKVCTDINTELSLAQKYLTIETIPYCQELIARAQNQLKEIDEFKTTHKKLKFNNINYLNILVLKRRKDIALLKEMVQTTIKNKEQLLKKEISILKIKLEKTTRTINMLAKHSQNINLEEIDKQSKLAESFRSTILTRMKEIGKIQQISIHLNYSTNIRSFPIPTNKFEADIIKSSERNRKIKERFCSSIDKLESQTKLKKITEKKELEEEYPKERNTIKRQAIDLEITKLKAELEEVMNSIETCYKTLENADTNKSNLENIDTATIDSLIGLAEFLDAEITFKSAELESIN